MMAAARLDRAPSPWIPTVGMPLLAQRVQRRVSLRWGVGLGKLCFVIALAAVLAPRTTLADLVAEPPAALADRIVSIPLQKLEELEAGARERIRETRVALDRRLADADQDSTELAEAYGRLGGLYAAYRLSAAAAGAFRNARELDPSSFRWVYYAADLALEFGEADAALSLLDKARTLEAAYPPLALRRGETLLALNRLDEAQSEYRAAARFEAQRAAALYGLAQIDLLRRDWSGAVDRFSQVLSLQPQAEAANYGLGTALARLGRRDEARAYLVQRGTVKPSYPDTLMAELRSLQRGARYHFEQAMAAVNRGDDAVAVHEFAAGLEEQPENARARTSYARALWIAGDHDGGLRELRQAASDGPQETLPRFLLAVVQDAAGDAEAAERSYKEVLALDDQHQGALTYLGSLKLRQGDPAAGADYLDRAIQAGANLFPVYLQYWGALRAQHAPLETLQEKLEAFTQRFPEPPVFRYLKAKLLVANGAGEQAVALAEQLMESQPIPPHAELLALCHAGAGKWSEAVEIQSNLIAMARQAGAGEELLERLEQAAARYGERRLPDPIWPARDPMFDPPPVEPGVPMKNYPASHPY